MNSINEGENEFMNQTGPQPFMAPKIPGQNSKDHARTLAELLESETGEAKTKEEKEFREYLDSFRMDLEGDPAIIKEDFNKQIEFSKKNSIQNANTRHLLTKRKLMHKLAQLLYRKDDPSEIYQEELTWRQLAIRQYVDENPELFKDWDTKYIDDL
eukprot:CAMPEP_0114602866 /NCGR_PEP_ID=MMETSP0125-20121206/25393_1 /TAXON_ID=485358 ORGANISM="Aristerostoma sp., Strain ATCC 50986" /NCGR_SAMPLE_ID=MMETSP0125 /ASSEMBLY_ACC=CAM_ASM_000245 /LENGTH=155 /DNA_ID=CAMNT_0001813339 /DNA_START=1044 /DNA_END=1508 /DNA_ORIENTATION=+